MAAVAAYRKRRDGESAIGVQTTRSRRPLQPINPLLALRLAAGLDGLSRCGVSFVFARIAYVIGLLRTTKESPGCFLGTAASCLVITALAVWLS
jgi:hypothetical protein